MNGRFCQCKDCKKQKRKGKILDAYWAGNYTYGGLMKVSGYVPYHRWMKGRRPDPTGFEGY